MQVVKIVKYNEDGSVAFEGEFGPNEVKYILDVGTNFLLQQGAILTEQQFDEAEEDDQDEFDFDPPDTVQ